MTKLTIESDEFWSYFASVLQVNTKDNRDFIIDFIDARLAEAYEQGKKDAATWRPIEEAPENGEFLVYMPNERSKIQVARFNSHVNVIGNCFAFDLTSPTLFAELPPLPKEPTE